MYEPNYAWLVVSGNEVWQVHAEECRHEPTGALTFWAGKDVRVLYAAFPPGSWDRVDIMSQMTGHANGRKLISTRTSAKAAWKNVD